MDRQVAKLIACIAENLPSMDSRVMQRWIDRPKALQEFLLGLNFITFVNRLAKPIYPGWMKKVMHPELELAGPAVYTLSQIELWLHDNQNLGKVKGHTIYEYLLEHHDILVSCLNLQDGLAIQQKGIAVFRELFDGKVVFLWGSVIEDCDGDLSVPSLGERGDEVVIHWNCLGNIWYSHCPALRFSK